MLTNDPTNSKILFLVSVSSVFVASILIGLKIWIGLKTSSVSVLASLLDSLTDLIASIINLIGITIGLKPADNNHNFGHAKAEGLSSFIQANFILGSAVFLIFSATNRLIYPEPIEQAKIAIIVMLLSILLTGLLNLFQLYVLRKTNSLSLKADTLHYSSDFLLNGSIIFALLLTQFGYTKVDPIFAIIIGAWMIYIASKIIRSTFTILMDETLPQEEVIEIKKTILSTPGVHNLHDLMTRSDGRTRYVSVHIELDKEQTFVASHKIATDVIDHLKQLSNNTRAFIHTDPISKKIEN